MSRYLVNLKKGNDYLVPSVFGGIDTTNVLATSTSSVIHEMRTYTYTATEDCFMCCGEVIYQSLGYLKLDGNDLFNNVKASSFIVPMKLGQTITFYAYNVPSYKVLGTKY